MRRGTTPTFQFAVNADLSEWDVYVSFGQHGKALTTWKPATIEPTEEGCRITVKLTQEETLLFKEDEEADFTTAQVRACNRGGQDAVATGQWKFSVEPILLAGEIPQEIANG